MNQLEVLRESLGQCDEIILDALIMRNRIVEDIMAYKEANGLQILQPEQEAKQKEWLDCAVQGGEFLKKHGHDGNYNWYFSLDRKGAPLVEPYNIFSYTFATMAFGQLSLATGNQEYADIAKRTFDIVLSKVDNPKGKWNKLYPGTRNLKGFALPMILCNLYLEIEHLLDDKFILVFMK